MVDRDIAHLWGRRALYVALAAGLAFMHLLPLQTEPRSWTGPNLLFALTLVWVVRRPEYVPVWLIAAVVLAADLIYHRPPGLWAALTVLAAEFLRAREVNFRNMTLPLEWLTVSVVMVISLAGYRMVLSVLAIPQAPLRLSLFEMALTVLAYPAVVAVSHVVFGVQKAAPGEVDALGHRL